MSGERELTPTAARVLSEAMSWIGTPYRHQAAAKGLGCDCLGLVRGIWRAVYGVEPEDPGPYAPDWAEAGRQDRLLEAARRHCREKAAAEGGPGDLVLFRWRAHHAAKHAGILLSDDSFIHAFEGHCVMVSALVPQWRRKVAGVFAFPDLPGDRA